MMVVSAGWHGMIPTSTPVASPSSFLLILPPYLFFRPTYLNTRCATFFLPHLQNQAPKKKNSTHSFNRRERDTIETHKKQTH